MQDVTVCLIPARGGSKRIPRKNIRLLNDKPLIGYTIEAAINSGCFENVFVSSDDQEILDIAEKFGAKTDLRPEELSGDTVKAVEVVEEFLQRPSHSGKWAYVAMCLPTCPFRTAEDVRNAVELFWRERNACPRLIGVTKCDFPPQLALTKEEGAPYVDMREPDAYGFSTRSQDCQDLFFPNGSVYASTVEEFLKVKTFFGRPMLSYVMPPERSFDIDYPYQFQIAECMMREIKQDKTKG
jgi:CMP-N-acetylneuraminic acid synthetase